MKVLIVDDEKITRSGLTASIDWDQLGIDTVLEASDGAEGLRIAFAEKPDIILTDMRMPRMDGVAMAEKLHESLPDSAIIFMSGYSDKEYLKAAIHLKAVSYVEKPLDTTEVTDAIRLAAEQLMEKGLVKRGRSVELAEHENRLAEMLTHSLVPETISDLSLPDGMSPDDHFTCLLFQFTGGELISIPGLRRIASEELSPVFAGRGISEIHVMKENSCICFFAYGQKSPRDTLRSICSRIRQTYDPDTLKCIVLGDTMHGISHAYDTYSGAVVLLQQAFFSEPGAILSNEEKTAHTPPIIKDYSQDYLEALEEEDRGLCDRVLADIHAQFMPPCRLLPGQVKDIYYQLFLTLQKAARKSRMTEILIKENQSIWAMVENADSLDVLHNELIHSTDEYFEGLSSRETGSNMVFAIKEFIRQNYRNESLSIKSVSDHVNRSAPYVCTFFKSETGLTLNQYITAYRIERAQEMLSDPRYKITDIAAKVGYTDVNYFGKIFKKVTNMSPSEFRSNLSAGNESYSNK
ncbi:MAG: response regulator [Lachnospiraceae bacterium]|nr:response regulator [Lachnospiraceae bacterium]